MLNQSLQNGLGEAVRRERKQRRETQVALAANALVSVPTIRRVERTKGQLTSFWKVLCALAVDLDGRNLPVGEHVGKRIALLRKRRGISQRALAALASVSQPTIIALERCRGRLETLEHVLTILGAGVYLVPHGQQRQFFTHAGNSSVHHGWHTPQELLEKLYQVFGIFDLDPCSPTNNRQRAPVRARVYFTPDDDGLDLPWHGRVFVNPPYGRLLPRWIAKAHAEVITGRAQSVVAVVPARTDTRWWHQDIAGIANVFLLRGRLRFGNINQSAPFPSAIILWGGDAETREKLKQVFTDAWYVGAGSI